MKGTYGIITILYRITGMRGDLLQTLWQLVGERGEGTYSIIIVPQLAGTYCNYGIVDVDTGLPGIIEGYFNHWLCRNDIIMM